MGSRGWIGVDLDGTLAEYDNWRGVRHIGAPVPKMLERVKRWIEEGREVRIFTARAATEDAEELAMLTAALDAWCIEHIGKPLVITCKKDYGMVELWDDRAIQVHENTGVRADGRA